MPASFPRASRACHFAGSGSRLKLRSSHQRGQLGQVGSTAAKKRELPIWRARPRRSRTRRRWSRRTRRGAKAAAALTDRTAPGRLDPLRLAAPGGACQRSMSSSSPRIRWKRSSRTLRAARRLRRRRRLFSKQRSKASDKPVYEIELQAGRRPVSAPLYGGAGGRQAVGGEAPFPGSTDAARQGFFPDGSRSFEEIDRTRDRRRGNGQPVCRRCATVDFFASCRRAASPRARRGSAQRHRRRRHRSGSARRDISPTSRYHLASAPPRPALAKATNEVQAILRAATMTARSGPGSPQVEESAYWFNLLIDTTLPICGNAAQRPQGQISADGPANIVDRRAYISPASGPMEGQEPLPAR